MRTGSKHRGWFSSLDGFVVWYNEEKPYGSFNLDIVETLSQAFVRKMRSEVWLGLAAKLFEWWKSMKNKTNNNSEIISGHHRELNTYKSFYLRAQTC